MSVKPQSDLIVFTETTAETVEHRVESNLPVVTYSACWRCGSLVTSPNRKSDLAVTRKPIALGAPANTKT